MAALVFNIAKGRVAELYNRVKSNDPANSAFVVLALATTGLETDAVLRDVDTVTALVAGTTNEVTNAGYARITVSDSGLAAMAPNDTTDNMDLDMADFAFAPIAAGDGWSKIVIAYDNDTTVANDASLIPCTMHDVSIIPDGSAITIQLNAAGFYRAS